MAKKLTAETRFLVLNRLRRHSDLWSLGRLSRSQSYQLQIRDGDVFVIGREAEGRKTRVTQCLSPNRSSMVVVIVILRVNITGNVDV